MSDSSVLVALEQQESITTPSVPETIGYLAMEAGSGTWSGMRYVANNTVMAVTNNWYQLSYTTAFESAPSLLTSLSTYHSGDNAHVRYTNSFSNGVQLKVEEDTTYDSELVHDTEAIAYLAIGGQGNLTAPLPPITIGEVGRVTSLTHAPQTILLDGDYISPVVFAQSASTSNLEPAVVRVSNIQSDRFTMYLAHPSNGDGFHNSPETVTYVVLEAGSHRLADGTKINVGTLETSATVGNRLSTSWDTVNFLEPFGSTPAVMTQIQSTNGANYLKTRYLATSASAFVVGLEPEESTTTQGVAETVGYFAIDAGTGKWDGLPYEAGVTDNSVTASWYQLTYASSFEAVPNLLTSLSTYVNADNAHVRYTNSLASGVQLKVEEDTTWDSEVGHSAEAIAFFAIDGEGLLTAASSVSPPKVIAFEQNGPSGPSNTLDTLSYTFDEEVVVTVDDLTLMDMSAGGAVVDLTGINFNYDPATNQATWYFDNVAAIYAHSYSSVLSATSIADKNGSPLDGNADGIGGDDYLQTIVVAGPGDANADGAVDGLDFGIWSTHSFTVTGGWNQADFNGDGVTDVRDFNIWNASKFTGQASSISSTSASSTSAVLRTPQAPAGSNAMAHVVEPPAIASGLRQRAEVFRVEMLGGDMSTDPPPQAKRVLSTDGQYYVTRSRIAGVERFFDTYPSAHARTGEVLASSLDMLAVDETSIDAVLAEFTTR